MYKDFTDTLQHYLDISKELNKELTAQNTELQQLNKINTAIQDAQNYEIDRQRKKIGALKFGKWVYMGIGAGAMYLFMR